MTLLSSTDRPRRSKIFALVKFFSERDHAQQFLNGDLFARRLSYFRRQEDQEGRWDSTEGVWAWLQKQGLEIDLSIPAIGEVRIREHDLAAPVSLSLGQPDNLYIYCMYCYYVQEPAAGDDLRDIYGEDRIAELEAALQLDPRCLRFGPHAVVIPFPPFMERLKHVNRSGALRLRTGLVHYYDNEVFNGQFKLSDVPFRKQKRFDYQREFRICIQTLDSSPHPKTFNIGSLKEMGHYVPSESLRNALKISLADRAA